LGVRVLRRCRQNRNNTTHRLCIAARALLAAKQLVPGQRVDTPSGPDQCAGFANARGCGPTLVSVRKFSSMRRARLREWEASEWILLPITSNEAA
jgi:hypothetical protein